MMTTSRIRRDPSCPSHGRGESSRQPENPARRIAPRRTHDAAAGMRGGAAHPQVSNRRLVLGPSRRRAEEEKLLERQLALKNVPFAQPELPLEIERRQHLPVEDDIA